MVTMPVMLAVFALLHLKWRTSLMIFGVTGRHGGLGLGRHRRNCSGRRRPSLSDYQLYKNENVPTSVGLRLEFWQKSLRFLCRGAGRSATARARRAGLFERAATGDTDQRHQPRSSAIRITRRLNVAVQWGIVGVVLLYAMWLVHLLLFRGDGLVAWIGLLVVVQNIFTSLFNSHIFDFHEGWMYVLGVGVAGGMTLAARQRNARAEPAGRRDGGGSPAQGDKFDRLDVVGHGLGPARSVRAHAQRRPHRGAGGGVAAVVDQRRGHRHGALACRAGRDARTAPVPAFVAAPDLRAADRARCARGAGNPVVGRALGRAPLCAEPRDEAAGAAVPVLSFRALDARHVGIRRVPGVLHADDGRVLDRRDSIPAFR